MSTERPYEGVPDDLLDILIEDCRMAPLRYACGSQQVAHRAELLPRLATERARRSRDRRGTAGHQAIVLEARREAHEALWHSPAGPACTNQRDYTTRVLDKLADLGTERATLALWGETHHACPWCAATTCLPVERDHGLYQSATGLVSSVRSIVHEALLSGGPEDKKAVIFDLEEMGSLLATLLKKPAAQE